MLRWTRHISVRSFATKIPTTMEWTSWWKAGQYETMLKTYDGLSQKDQEYGVDATSNAGFILRTLGKLRQRQRMNAYCAKTLQKLPSSPQETVLLYTAALNAFLDTEQSAQALQLMQCTATTSFLLQHGKVSQTMYIASMSAALVQENVLFMEELYTSSIKHWGHTPGWKSLLPLLQLLALKHEWKKVYFWYDDYLRIVGSSSLPLCHKMAECHIYGLSHAPSRRIQQILDKLSKQPIYTQNQCDALIFVFTALGHLPRALLALKKGTTKGYYKVQRNNTPSGGKHTTIVDLHSLTVSVSRVVILHTLQTFMKKPQDVVFIVGRGKQSPDSTSKLRPAAEAYLHEIGLYPTRMEGNNGRLCIGRDQVAKYKATTTSVRVHCTSSTL